ncbi:hypothetical protein C8F01DRAFT_1367401 [Mycena amicta]|nr:hypothetical protein C8F01DRAFT_1367401 [Mycena amicta]
MHPLFEHRNLLQLSPQLKRITLAVCQKDCTADDLAAFQVLTGPGRLDHPVERPHLLPVFWTLLDPARIPVVPVEDDGFSSRTKLAIRAAMQALSGLYRTKAPNKAQQDIWSRLVPWVHFLVVFWPCYNTDDFSRHLAERLLLIDFVRYTAQTFMRDGGGDLSGPWKTKHFHTLVVWAWAAALRAHRKDDDFDSSWIAFCIGLLPQTPNRAQYEEIIDAAGGTLDSLALLVRRHLVIAIPFLSQDYPKANTPGLLFSLVRHATNLVWVIDGALLSSNPTGTAALRPVEPPLSSALAARGGVKHLTKALVTLTDAKSVQFARRVPGQWDATLLDLVSVLGMTFFVGPDSLRTALRHGLLQGILAAGQYPLQPRLTEKLAFWLDKVFTSAAMYASVITVLRQAIGAVTEELTATPVFKGSKLYEPWQTLKSVVAAQKRVLVKFQLKRPCLRACDSVLCGRIAAKSLFRRCGGCSARYYCSAECQTEDWAAGHRATCGICRDSRLAVRRVFSAAHLAFLRFTVTHYYEQARAQVHCGAALAGAVDYAMTTAKSKSKLELSTATLPPCVTALDFQSGPVQHTISSHPSRHPSMRAQVIPCDPTLDDWLARAARSRGKIAVHTVCVRLGSDSVWLVLPLRMNSSFLKDSAEAVVDLHVNPPARIIARAASKEQLCDHLMLARLMDE